jgi:hypothetical protein
MLESLVLKKVLNHTLNQILLIYNNYLNDLYGAPTRARTADLLIKNQLAFEVRYSLTVAAGFNNFTTIPVSQAVLRQ